MKHALVAGFRKGQKKRSKNIWQRIGTVYLCNPIWNRHLEKRGKRRKKERL